MSDAPGGHARLRNLALGATGLAAVGAGVGGAVAYNSRFRAPFAPVLEQVEIPGFSAIPPDPPLRIGFVTDLHIGPAFRAVDAERALNLIAEAEPDLILLGGDYVCESPRYLREATAVMTTYLSHARLGALAVLGNHDYSNDASRLTSLLEHGGIRVLCNEAVCVSTDSLQFWVAGIDDAILGRPDLAAAFAPIPAGAKALALWHEPDWAERSASFGAVLQLSGHSHGGQVRVPIVGPVATPFGGRRFVAGANFIEDMTVYTSRGVGIYRPPVRFRCPPEVTLITLC